jgi:integrase
MEQPKVFVSFFLDASRPNSDGKCLVKMNVYQKPHKKRYATKFHLSEDEWEKVNSSKLRDEELKKTRGKLQELRTKAEKVIDKIVPFSFIAFEEAFYSDVQDRKSTMLKHWFDDYIKKLKANDQIGTAISYQTTINSINDFKKNLQIHDITSGFLHEYEKHLLNDGKSISTVGIYMRQLRTIINQAISGGLMAMEKYPFKKYEIPAGRNIKKALSEADIGLLLNYTPTKPDEQKALDFWLLSYLCNGMNFADIIALKPENINSNYLHFIRQKTKNTKKKDLRPIRVGLNPRAKTIIEKWKNTDPENPYLFPVLEANISAVTIKHRCQRFIKWVNKRMEDIRKELKIEQPIGTYAARHSFSTVLKRKGVSTDFIKEALGHSSTVVTENYLDSFTDDVKLEYANLLTNL